MPTRSANHVTTSFLRACLGAMLAIIVLYACSCACATAIAFADDVQASISEDIALDTASAPVEEQTSPDVAPQDSPPVVADPPLASPAQETGTEAAAHIAEQDMAAPEAPADIVVHEEKATFEYASFTEEELGKLPSNDELFAGYVDRAFYGDTTLGPLADYGESIFSGNTLKIYQAVRAKCKDVAEGKLASTQFFFDYATDFGIDATLTAEEYGQRFTSENVNDAIKILQARMLGADFNLRTFRSCLMLDYPYELYWFDKTVSAGYSTGNYSWTGSSIVCKGPLQFDMPVAKGYSVSNTTGTFAADVSKTAATSVAVENANAIVTESSALSDYDKLLAYKDRICELVSYNHEAADTEGYPYGDPWQLVYVFDGDANTNVVCEGYSKAFQYLCDKSVFSSPDVKSYIVSGYLVSSSGSGGHMWNHVRLDGAMYLVDVTNCDSGSSGYPNKLFMVGVKPVNGVYTFPTSSSSGGTGFQFYDETIALYAGTNVLDLASANYAGVSLGSLEAPAALTYGYASSAAPTLSMTATIVGNATGASLQYQWYMARSGKTPLQLPGPLPQPTRSPLASMPGRTRFIVLSC